jgi:hypothetical protein
MAKRMSPLAPVGRAAVEAGAAGSELVSAPSAGSTLKPAVVRREDLRKLRRSSLFI